MKTPRFFPWLYLVVFCLLAVAGSFTGLQACSCSYGPGGLPIEFKQPDGTTLSLRVHGNHFYGRTETLDGYTVIFDPATKSYHYATLSADGKNFASTGKVVGKAAPETLGLKKGVDLDHVAKSELARKHADAHEAVVKQNARWEAVRTASLKYEKFKDELKKHKGTGKKGIAIPMGTIFPDSEVPASASGPLLAGGTLVGGTLVGSTPATFTAASKVVGLTILVDFADCVGNVVTQTQIDDYFNKPGYTEFSNAGSVYDYFYAQSCGNLQ